MSPPPWTPVAAPPPLPPGEIHLWWLGLERAPEGAGEMLDRGERARLAAMGSAGGRRRFLATRGQLRLLLGGYLGLAPAAVEIVIRQGGRPVLGGGTGLDFNLSHSGDAALLAVGRDLPVGVDLERLRPQPRLRAIAQRVFSAEERALLERDDHSLTTFYRLWTALEARQKLFGQGLFATRVPPGAAGSRGLEPRAGYLACLAWGDPGRHPAPPLSLLRRVP